MSDYYPQGVGVKLEKSSISQEDLKSLVSHFPKNVVLRVFGFAGTGKGTLSNSLAEILQIPNVESSLIWRAITLIYEDLGLELNPTNSDQVLSQLSVLPGAKNVLGVFYKDQPITRVELKSALVDSKVALYAADGYLREKFYDLLIQFLQNLDSSCVLDGRGAYPRYIKEAEKSGYKIIRLLLDASETEMAHRYYSAYLAKRQAKDPGHVETVAEKNQMMQDFKQGIVARNKQDWETWHKLDLGIITDDTAIVDTTGMEIQEVTETVLSYIKKELEL